VARSSLEGNGCTKLVRFGNSSGWSRQWGGCIGRSADATV